MQCYLVVNQTSCHGFSRLQKVSKNLANKTIRMKVLEKGLHNCKFYNERSIVKIAGTIENFAMAVKRKRITLRRLYPKSYIEVTVWVLSSYYQNLSILWNLSLLGTWNNLNLVLKTLLFTLDLRWALCLKGGKAPYLNKFEPLSIRLSAKKYQMFRCCIRVPCCECVWLIYDMYLAI